MRNGTTIYRAGPFEVDSGQRRVTRGGESIHLPGRHFDCLVTLLANAGRFVPKNALLDAAWDGVIVSEASLDVAIWNLRKALGRQADGAHYIENRVRHGYRFAAPVESVDAPPDIASLDALLEPYGAFTDGRAAVELLYLDGIAKAVGVFTTVLRAAPGHVRAHVGLAYAYVLLFESTRADTAPNLAALRDARRYAERACQIDPASPDAWSALAFVAHRAGEVDRGVKAARRAVTLQPTNWQHRLRLGSVTWGEECLQACETAITLCPGLAFPEWFITRLFVGRQAWDRALEHVRAGCAAQDAQRPGAGCHAVGLHLLHAHLLFVLDRLDEAVEELARERAAANPRHVFARECAANTSYLAGAIHYRRGHIEHAREAFLEAQTHIGGHPLARVGLAAVSPDAHAALARLAEGDASTIARALVACAALSVRGEHERSARVFQDALGSSPPGPAGWMVAVDPLIHPTAHGVAWSRVLATLRARAV